MEREVRQWAKENTYGNKWNIWKVSLIVSLITGIISGLISAIAGDPDAVNASPLSQVLTFIAELALLPMSIGVIAYVVDLVKGNEFNVNQIFSKYNQIIRIILTSFLEGIIVFLYTLLLIIPGIIRSISYNLVNYILADPDFDGLGSQDILKLSKELMNGHKLEWFIMNLYYALILFLGVFTLGILWIWTIPQVTLANTKFATELLEQHKANA